MSAAIELRSVRKCYGEKVAVRALDLDVPEGSVCGFVGPNGAGKSTTIRMIMSIIRPDSGTISVLGGDALARKDRIGYLPEERGVYRKMRVAEFLEYVAHLKGVSDRGLRGRIRAWLDRVDLADSARRRCQELSKGMQQKVQFLAAILHEPELVILDEPFSGLDPVNADLLHDLVVEMRKEGRTIIFSTHVLEQAETLCDRIFMINRGEKLLDGPLEEIRAQFDPRTIEVEPIDGAVLDAAPRGVDDIQRRPDGVLELHLEDGADVQAVFAEVVGRMAVRSIRLRRLALREIFIDLVRRGGGADAARAAAREFAHG